MEQDRLTRSQRASLGALLAVQVALGLLLASALPLWIGHEGDYFRNVRFLVDTGRLPERSDFDGAVRGADIAQATQGPLFFYVTAPIVALLDDGAPVPPGVHPALVCDGITAPISYGNMLTRSYNWPLTGAPAAGLAIRIFNLLFGLGTTTIVYFTARRLPFSTHTLALVAAAFLAFFPQVFSLNVFISGESLLLFVSSLNLYFALRLIQSPAIRPLDMSLLIATAIIGPLIKTNGYVLVVATAIVLIFLVFRHVVRAPRSRSTRLVVLGVVFLALALVVLGIFNLAQYGSVVGRYQDILTVAISGFGDIHVENLVFTLRDTLLDYISTFPVQREKALWIYVAGGMIGLIAFCVLTLVHLIRRDWRALGSKLLLFVYAFTAVALVLVRGNLTGAFAPDKAYAPLRYYLSGLPALAIMSALGWEALSHAVFRNRFMLRRDVGISWYGRLSTANLLGGAWAAIWFSIATLTVLQAVQSSTWDYSMTPAEFVELAKQSTLAEPIDSASPASDSPQLLAIKQLVSNDGMLRLVAYLSVDETPTLNQVATVTVSDVQGRTSSCEIIPQNGLNPVTRWEPGQVMTVPIEIPNCAVQDARSMQSPLEVSIGWRRANSQGEFVDSTVRSVSRVLLETDLPRYAGCMPNLGVIGGIFQVVQFNGPNTLAAGELFIPSVNWYVRDIIEDGDLSRIYTLTNRGTGQTFTCQGIPRLGDYPIGQWRRGETVYFDQCAFAIPDNAPTGVYSLSVGLLDNASGELLPVESSDGGFTSEGMLEIAELIMEPSA